MEQNIETRMGLIEAYNSAENLTAEEKEQYRAKLLDTMTDYEKGIFADGDVAKVASLLAGYRAQAKVFEQRADDLKECALIFGFPSDEAVLVQSGNKAVTITTKTSEVDTADLVNTYPAEAEAVLAHKRASITVGKLTISDFERASKAGVIDKKFLDFLPRTIKRLIKLNVREVKKN